MRLTQAHRRNIRRELIDERFNQRLEVVEMQLKKFALTVYHDKFGRDVEKMNALPDGWLPECEEIKARFGNSDVRLDLPSPQRIPYEFENQYSNRATKFIAAYESGSKLCRQYEQLSKEQQDLLNQREKAHIKISLAF